MSAGKSYEDEREESEAWVKACQDMNARIEINSSAGPKLEFCEECDAVHPEDMCADEEGTDPRPIP